MDGRWETTYQIGSPTLEQALEYRSEVHRFMMEELEENKNNA